MSSGVFFLPYQERHNKQAATNCQHKSVWEDLAGVHGRLSEDVVDLWLLAVTQRSDGGRRGAAVVLQLQVESFGEDRLGGAEGANDDAGFERVGRAEELDGDVFLALQTKEMRASVPSLQWLLSSVAFFGVQNNEKTYDLHLALAIVSNTQRVGRLKTGGLVLEQEEGLVGTLGLAIVFGR